MLIKEIVDVLNADLLSGEELLNEQIIYGYGSDCMSDVLAFVQNNVLLLTGLNHPQLIRTAELLDIKAIVIVRGKQPCEEVLTLAKESGIAIIKTHHSLFKACGILYSKGLRGEEVHHELTF